MALSALQDFFELGGQPDAQMFDTVLDVCVRTGHFRRAMQAGLLPSAGAMSLKSLRNLLAGQSHAIEALLAAMLVQGMPYQSKQESWLSNSTTKKYIVPLILYRCA